MRLILKKLLVESSIYSIEPILKKALLFFLLPLYTAYLSPSDYGKLEYIITISAFFGIVATGGLQTGFFKYGFGAETEFRKVVLFNTLIASLLISILALIIAYFVKGAFFKDNYISFLFSYLISQ